MATIFPCLLYFYLLCAVFCELKITVITESDVTLFSLWLVLFLLKEIRLNNLFCFMKP
jgi:hypothetical protein